MIAPLGRRLVGIVLWCIALWGVLVWACSMGAAWAQGAAPQPKPATPSIGDGGGGVIAPRGDVDPKMQITPPDPGLTPMPIIPPPGAPGGNPNVIPK
jgi:hypothetical protein